MKLNRRFIWFEALLLALVIALTSSLNLLRAETSTCSGTSVELPFNDILNSQSAGFFCQIAEAFFSGLTNGTTATTYSPDATVTRGQMAAFITRTLDQSLRRNNRRAVTEKWYLPPDETGITLTTVDGPRGIKFDGTDLWVANFGSDTVQRIRPSDGKVLETWTNAVGATQLVVARGRIFALSSFSQALNRLYFIDPTQPPGAVSTLISNLPTGDGSIAFDGARLWITSSASSSVLIISLNPTTVTTVTTGFSSPFGILFDGNNIWVTDRGRSELLKLGANGDILAAVPVGGSSGHPVFDGINIWVPSRNDKNLTVVRVKDSSSNPLATPFVLATLTGNGLNQPVAAAFDGERIMVVNAITDAQVSLFKAADLSPLDSISSGTIDLSSSGVCSDGMNFWVSLSFTDKVARF